jgi:hypothetical protein
MTVSPGKKVLYRMGYYNDQAGIIRRFNIEGSAWATHLKNTRDIILRAVSIFNPHNIVVLGSGWLLDLPIEEITKDKRSVTLVDLIIPPQIKQTISSYENVSYMTVDATGGLISRIYDNFPGRLRRKKFEIGSVLNFKPYNPPENTDLLISLNILTQLDSLPVEYLKRRSIISDNEVFLLRKQVQQQHIDMLQKCNSVLITEFCEHPANSSDNIDLQPTLAVELPEGILREEWEWNFDSHRSYHSDRTTVFRVAGIVFRG